MLCKQLFRQSITNIRLHATQKSPLAELRKKTGYSFINCKKALELHNNDLVKAEQWLKDQAQALGWAKATKLEGRATAQGLVGVLVRNNIGAMIEVNCETDFVSRNEQFQQFVAVASKACLNYVNELPDSNLLCRTEFQTEALKNLLTENDKKLSDDLALTIGLVGENATLKRAVCFKVTDDIQLAGMAYPTKTNSLVTDGQVTFGSFGSLIAFKSPNPLPQDLKKDISLQIIGLNPQKVGDKNKDKPAADKDDETCLIYQEYLFDPEIKVGELLEENKVEIVDFQRYKCGEEISSQSIEGVDAAAASN